MQDQTNRAVILSAIASGAPLPYMLTQVTEEAHSLIGEAVNWAGKRSMRPRQPGPLTRAARAVTGTWPAFLARYYVRETWRSVPGPVARQGDPHRGSSRRANPIRGDGPGCRVRCERGPQGQEGGRTVSYSSNIAQAYDRRHRREQQLVHLIEVGDMPGTPAVDLAVGDRLMWNYGAVYKVLSVRAVSPKFMEIRERAEDKPDGEVYTRGSAKTGS